MKSSEALSDILVIHKERLLFSSGIGPLTKHSKTAATVTQVLNLFSQKIMSGEPIHFIRFEKHRMIFLTSPIGKEDNLTAIVLIPIDKSARQVIPAMGIALNLLKEFLAGEVLDAQNRHLDCFYQILSSPQDAVFLIPRTPEGILGALVILTAFAHDLQFGIQQLTSNIHFVDPDNETELRENILKSERMRILSFTPLPDVENNDNILVFGQENPLRQYFSALPGEKVYDVIARIFGSQSNAAKMSKFISNEDALEIAQAIAMLPRREDVFIRNDILLSTVLNPGKDIVVTLSTPVMEKLRELSSTTAKVEPEPTPELSNLTVELKPTPKKTQQLPIEDITQTTEAIEQLHPEPDAITSSEPVTPSKPIITPRVLKPEILERLEKTRKSGLEYKFDTLPIILDTAPFALNITDSQPLDFNRNEIIVRIFQGIDNHFRIHIYTDQDRLESFKETLEDLSVRIGGETQLREDYVLVEGILDKLQMTLRALLWLCIVEYLTQVQMNRFQISPRFNIPRDGSILIIPPNRDYVKEKIPSKFTTFIEERDIRDQIELEALWTLGKAQDAILSVLLEPLRQGEGVVFVASESNKEMEEIALFLLLISEVCGIGFSRW
ncbi:MAG: hypothetical protein ACTSW1_10520 [Candidatus Hodarchaeales archaeon]